MVDNIFFFKFSVAGLGIVLGFLIKMVVEKVDLVLRMSSSKIQSFHEARERSVCASNGMVLFFVQI